MRETTPWEKLIFTLGWEPDDFWRDIQVSDERTLREALKILEVPPVDTLEYGAIEAIREQLAKRFNVTP